MPLSTLNAQYVFVGGAFQPRFFYKVAAGKPLQPHLGKAINNHLTIIFSTPQKWLPAVIVLLLELITITPLCGFLFQCGCDWPWFGLDEKCNFYQQNIARQCPWCVSMLMGIFSTVLAIASGVLIASASLGGISVLGVKQQFFIRIVLGLSMYVAVASIMAVTAALII